MNKLTISSNSISPQEIIAILILNTLLGLCFFFLVKHPIAIGLFTLLTTSIITYAYYLKKQLKNFEYNLSLSEDLLIAIFNNSTDNMFLLNTKDNSIIDCNTSALRSFEVQDKSKMIGKFMQDLCKDTYLVDMGRVMKKINGGGTWAMEMECCTYHNTNFWGYFTLKKIKVSDRYYHLLRISNVTTLKDTEASLEQQNISLKKEKKKLIKANKDVTILLKEVHHRVKNNLQVIMSLLRLQSSFIDDDKLQKAFEESIGRISTMSIIHENLYKSKNLERVSIEDYFNELTENVIHSYRHGTDIQSNIIIEDVDFGLDVMIPLGLLLNELTTNSIKHGFNGLEQGEINVKIANEDGYVFRYSDNGHGFPDDYNVYDEKTFGSTIIVSLVSQLDGKIETNHPEKGMGYSIRFHNTGRENVIVKV